MQKKLLTLVVFAIGSVSVVILLGGIPVGHRVSYYERLHAKMIECNQFVQKELRESGRLPNSEMMDDWIQKNMGTSRSYVTNFSLGERGSSQSFSLLEGQSFSASFVDYRIGCWTGERFEFFNAWDESFTTSIKEIWRTDFYCFGAGLIGIGFAIWLNRRYSTKFVKRTICR